MGEKGLRIVNGGLRDSRAREHVGNGFDALSRREFADVRAGALFVLRFVDAILVLVRVSTVRPATASVSPPFTK